MKKSYKWTLGSLASLAIGFGVVGAAIFTRPVKALAEDAAAPVSYINVGASEALTASEFYFENAALAADSSAAGAAGVNEEGLGVFASYRTNASVSVPVAAGEYRVAALVDTDGAITVNGGDSVSAEGKRVISVTVEATDSVTVATTADVKLYAVMVAPKESKILMHSEWTRQQVVVYGRLLEDELTRVCPAFYSDGSVENAVEYDSIPAGVGDGSTGANENFNAVTAKGTYTATDNPVDVERALIIMPERLVYFVNAGSVTDHVGVYGNDSDPYYSYNKTVFDYYRSVGSTLKNDGVPDAETSDSNSFGHYTAGWNGIAKKFAYPFNTGRVTNKGDFGTTNVGFYLPDVEAGSYRVYIGTASFWHGRTLGVKINNADKPSIFVPPSRQVHVFDNVQHSGGTMNISLIGPAADDEALANFVALQKMEDAPRETAPADIAAEAPTISPSARALKLTGVEEGAIVQIYGGSRPYKLIYEEKAVKDNFADGVYTLSFDDSVAEKIIGEDKIRVIQRNAGGYGGTYEIAVTSIRDYSVRYKIGGDEFTAPKYTTGSIDVIVSAFADDGIEKIEVRKGYGDYKDLITFDPAVTYAEGEYTVTENGSYEFVFWSGSIKYANRVEINHIDAVLPSLSFTPAAPKNNQFPVTVKVEAVSGIDSYEAVKGGDTVLSGTAKDTEFVVEFPGAGEYALTVTNGAKQSATVTIVVGNKPVYSTLQKRLRGSSIQLTFNCVGDYNMSSLTVYRLSDVDATRLSILGNNQVELYDAGAYAAVIKTAEGTTEVYSFEIGADEFRSNTTKTPGTTNNNESYTGTIAAACIFGVALIALAVVFFVVGKKKPAKQTAQAKAGGSAAQKEPADIGAEEPEKEEPQTEEAAADSEEDDEI